MSPSGVSSAPINPLVAAVASPPIPQAQRWLRRYDGAHGPLVDLSQAVPGDPPHPAFLERLAATAAAPEAARYGPITGEPGLREAYAAQVSSRYGGPVAAEDVAITAGCNLAFVVAMMALARHGEAVLLPSPWYFNHKMTLDMLGVEARALPCRPAAGFVPAAADAEALIDARTRAIVLVTPNNPTGAVYPVPVIESFAELCRARGLWLVIDETYRDFLPSGLERPHGVLAGSDWRERVIQLYSFSKAYCIPGHRTGAIVADAAAISEVAKILDCLQICAPRVAQGPLAWAIEHLSAWRAANRDEINQRAAAFRRALAPVPGWRIESIGAYFAYLRHPFGSRSGHDVAESLAAERGVLCLPGGYFGPDQDRHLRVAFANVAAEALESLGPRFADLAL